MKDTQRPSEPPLNILSARTIDPDRSFRVNHTRV
jgi:hypothetical protein